MRYYYIPIRRAKTKALKTTDNYRSWRRRRTIETCAQQVGVHSISHLENSVTLSYKVSIHLAYESGILPLWGMLTVSSSTVTAKPGSHLDESSSADEEINCGTSLGQNTTHQQRRTNYGSMHHHQWFPNIAS